jgi:hypothetical protein
MTNIYGRSTPRTDNGSMADKILLRRTMLTEAKFPELHVLDLYAGDGIIWKELSKQFALTSYLPVDHKPKLPGTLKLHVDARTVKAFRPDNFNVIDIDAYGDPWAMLPHFMSGNKPVLIFLTHGSLVVGWKSLDISLKKAVGIPAHWQTPVSQELVAFCALQFLRRYADRVRIAKMAHRTGRADVRYYGLLLR